MRKIILLVILFIFTSGRLHAQSMGRSYKNAIGLKFWDGVGVTFKTFVAPKNALEVVGFFNRRQSRLTSLYEIHNNVAGTPGLRWYIGPGAHIAFYDTKNNFGERTFAGVDGVLGLDYKVINAPLNISIDWQPSFEFGDNRGFAGSWGGIGIRYTL